MHVLNTFPINNWATPTLSEPSIRVPQGSDLITAFDDFVGDIRVAYCGDPTQPEVIVYFRVYTDGAMIDPRELKEWRHLASFFHREQNKTMHVFYRPF
jgi:hypothetical protein